MLFRPYFDFNPNKYKHWESEIRIMYNKKRESARTNRNKYSVFDHPVERSNNKKKNWAGDSIVHRIFCILNTQKDYGYLFPFSFVILTDKQWVFVVEKTPKISVLFA